MGAGRGSSSWLLGLREHTPSGRCRSPVMSGIARSVPGAVVVLLGLGLAACAADDGRGVHKPPTGEPGPDSKPRADALVELASRGARLTVLRQAL